MAANNTALAALARHFGMAEERIDALPEDDLVSETWTMILADMGAPDRALMRSMRGNLVVCLTDDRFIALIKRDARLIIAATL